MEKILRQMNQDVYKANKILEINADHEIFASIKKMNDDGKDISEYVELLYDQALLIAGLNIDDPAAYAQKIAKLMIKAAE